MDEMASFEGMGMEYGRGTKYLEGFQGLSVLGHNRWAADAKDVIGGRKNSISSCKQSSYVMSRYAGKQARQH
jgi:hypothetical protein